MIKKTKSESEKLKEQEEKEFIDKRGIGKMSDEEFEAYINKIETNKPVAEKNPESEEMLSEDKDADMRLFDRIKRIAMGVYNTQNSDEALYKMLIAITKPAGGANDVKPPVQNVSQADSRNRYIMYQIGQIKQRYPEFDFNSCMNEPAFAREFLRSGNVALALMSLNDDMRRTRQPKRRISENGMSGSGAAGAVRRSPSEMSDAEFKKYIEKISRGTGI